MVDNHLVFYVENQAVVRWGLRRSDLDLEDPPVYVQSVDNADVWIKESSTASEFALQMLVFCVQFVAPTRWICGFPDDSLMEVIRSRFPRLAFPRWSWTQCQMYGYRDIVVNVQGHGHIHVAARNEDAYQVFADLITPTNFDVAAGWEDL